MNRLGLFYQSFVLFAVCRYGLCQRMQYKLGVMSLRIDDIEKKWDSACICKYWSQDRFTFSKDELTALCGADEFYSWNIEILGLVDREMRFSYDRPNNDPPLYFNVTFLSNSDIQKFFRDIRFNQRHLCGKNIKVKKLYQSSENELFKGVQTLIPLSCNSEFYVKNLDAKLSEYPRTFNFIRYTGTGKRTHEADLIIQPKTFNISPRLGDNIYVLCSNHMQKFSYVILFPDKANADEFYRAVVNDVDREIPCTNDWLTPKSQKEINSPKMPKLSHLPYVKPW